MDGTGHWTLCLFKAADEVLKTIQITRSIGCLPLGQLLTWRLLRKLDPETRVSSAGLEPGAMEPSRCLRLLGVLGGLVGHLLSFAPLFCLIQVWAQDPAVGLSSDAIGWPLWEGKSSLWEEALPCLPPPSCWTHGWLGSQTPDQLLKRNLDPRNRDLKWSFPCGCWK